MKDHLTFDDLTKIWLIYARTGELEQDGPWNLVVSPWVYAQMLYKAPFQSESLDFIDGKLATEQIGSFEAIRVGNTLGLETYLCKNLHGREVFGVTSRQEFPILWDKRGSV